MGEIDQAQRFDVVIVGAGISGIDAAYHLQRDCPERRYVILDALESFGGTWWTHKYPGVRSDSDLYTFGYSFKPWTGDPIAKADRILAYMGEVISENAIDQHIRYRHRVTDASWSSDTNTWTLSVTDLASGAVETYHCEFLWMCQGYYRHEKGYTPEWPDFDTYEGRVVHPQTWPEEIDLADQEVLVIGSGATAATLVPSIADQCRHVTMLQRSPTYFFYGENRDELADQLRALEINEEWIHEIVRRNRLAQLAMLNDLAKNEPTFLADELIKLVRAALPEDYDVETHFTPRYRPWQQRLAYVPDADLFQGISSGQASVVTDEIERFTPSGVVLKSGQELKADVIITATGFELSVLGDVRFTIDEVALDLAQTITYRGTMFTGVPNLSWIFGYFRASWTLRADLVCAFICRILNYMSQNDLHRVVPTLREEDRHDEVMAWISEENFNPGYMMRSLHLMPKRLAKPEWEHSQDYWFEKDILASVPAHDDCLVYR
ncbi:MAG TPA: NAD(P)/FAD-dependent oxidoreductase [Acidimicrobiales bacterium]|nr:NAD(P)/FAD-dependent oxidoreductase [Acidimicrobiales bacterium]